MRDDKSNRGPADRARINVHESYEVEYLSKELDVTPEGSGSSCRNTACWLQMSGRLSESNCVFILKHISKDCTEMSASAFDSTQA
jgi:hypothetical protein